MAKTLSKQNQQSPQSKLAQQFQSECHLSMLIHKSQELQRYRGCLQQLRQRVLQMAYKQYCHISVSYQHMRLYIDLHDKNITRTPIRSSKRIIGPYLLGNTNKCQQDYYNHCIFQLQETIKFIILNFNLSTNTMNLQKIKNNLKNTQRDFKHRFQYEQELQAIAKEVASNNLNPDNKIVEELVLADSSNIRQKFKVYKRYIESQDPKDQQHRIFSTKYLTNLHIKEYLYGNTESKPILLNTLKRLNQLQPFTQEQFGHIFLQISIQDYQECRNLLELLDMLIRNGNNQLYQKSEYVHLLFLIILKQFEQGTKKIVGDSFKLKWIQFFVDVLRSLNTLYRIYSKYFQADTKELILKNIKILAFNHKILTKQVLTQAFLLLLQINPTEPRPDESNMVCIIHYLHAKNVILGQNILEQLMNLLPIVKQTEHKCQLAPILMKAFHNYYHTYKDKQNVFDNVVTLFEVGRSIYTYLEEIIAMIMKDPQAQWNLEGNYIRKFFLATIALKNGFNTDLIFSQWPNIIQDSIIQAGNMTIPYASDCAQKLFQKLYDEQGKDYNKWISRWIDDYKQSLSSMSNRGNIRGIIEFINPIILSVDSQPIILKQILALSEIDHNHGSLTIGVISLLKCFKELSKIIVDNQNGRFIHAEDPTIIFTKQQIKNMLLSNDSGIALKALQFLTVNQKSSAPMQPLQLELTEQFFVNSLKTSLPQYRKSYLNATKKMFERLRTVYENELTKSQVDLKKNKRYKPRQYYSNFKIFLNRLIDLCYENIFPDVIFEIANPALEILVLIGTYFNRNRIEVKKGQIFQASHILTETKYFEHRNFENLLCCLQSSYESVRILANQILTFFYDIEAVDQLKWLWSESLINANKLTIKSYEYACRILAFISQTYPHILQLPKKYQLRELNICEMFLIIMKQRYEIFKVQFATQEESYYKNLIHGIQTVFSYTFDHIADQIRADAQRFKPYFEEIKAFLSEFFELMNQIILFSVQICSSNISTVVLDSIPQSQTDRTFKVDCRGHFLEETSKSVGNIFQSTALLSSMENQQEGIENMLVVSFYLLTREAGLVFQSIGNIVGTSYSNQYIPSDGLVKLVNTYFYALINLKHMGSVDRISNGLGKMAKVIFDNEDKKLSELPQKLLDKLLTNLKEGNFTNILRRSAGVPYAFTCLLKSEALRRKQMIEDTIKTLLQLSHHLKDVSIELKIHSLNILKKLFQDGDLKAELDPYISSAFMVSIKGFSSEQWGVRNSSLMLFSVLANRTVGIKPTFNLLQFFHRCPLLINFFTQQLQNMNLNTMYPPLYPIVLLLSRLLPFDLKEKPKINNKSQMNLKEIRKQKLLQILPLIERAGENNNYMGRVMTAKAILPFMEINGIIPYSLNLLQDLHSIKSNNLVHYKLSTAFHLLTSLLQITHDQKYEVKITAEIKKSFEQTLNILAKLALRKQSGVVLQFILKLINHIISHYSIYFNTSNGFKQATEKIYLFSKNILKKYFETTNLIINMNMGDSVTIKQCLSLHNLLLEYFQQNIKITRIVENYSEFLLFLQIQIQANNQYLLYADTEIVEEYLSGIARYLSTKQSSQQLNDKIRNVIGMLNMSKISSDNVLIQVLTIRSILKISPENGLIDFLEQLQKKTNNHFLKISIFKYIQSIDCKHPILMNLLRKFSKPQQLQQLRQCCVEHLQNTSEIIEANYIVYIRLLEDEQFEIRLQTARILAPKLGLPLCNDEVVKNHILKHLSINNFQQLLKQASDYDVKSKNNEQDRIFSFDKPNKYRSDISNVIYCLLSNGKIKSSRKQLGQIASKLFKQLNIAQEVLKTTIDKYMADIINRNEFQFQTILRLFLINDPQNQTKFSTIFTQHPLLQRIYKNYIK